MRRASRRLGVVACGNWMVADQSVMLSGGCMQRQDDTYGHAAALLLPRTLPPSFLPKFADVQHLHKIEVRPQQARGQPPPPMRPIHAHAVDGQQLCRWEREW